METYTRIAIRHKESRLYIGRTLEHQTGHMGMVKSMRGSIHFSDMADASEWLLNAWCAPKDTEQYEYVTIKYELTEVIGNERKAELVSED